MYAVENIRGFYFEEEGPLRGWRKKGFSTIALGATFVSYTLGSAMRKGVIKNLHSVGDAVFSRIQTPWKRLLIGVPAVMIGGLIYLVPRAIDGTLDGLKRWGKEFRDGFRRKHLPELGVREK